MRLNALVCLNAPYGAPCFLTREDYQSGMSQTWGLNAPYGAPCFLTLRPELP